MSWLLVKSTERRETGPLASLEGAHLWGDVVEIGQDHFPVDHLVPEPFLAISVDAERSDLEYLLDPLLEQHAVDQDTGQQPLYRKRYAVDIEALPSQKRLELCATGKTTLTHYQLENALLQRG